MVVLKGGFMKNFRFDTIYSLQQYPGTTRTTEVKLCLWVHKYIINCCQIRRTY